jgi:hypothetical protein
MRLVAFCVTAVLCFLVGCAARTPDQQVQNDDAHYASTLKPYLSDLKPGASRKTVEEYFRARNISFSHENDHFVASPPDVFDRAYSDVIALRQETRPWPCGSSNVYIIFSFTGTQPYSGLGHIEASDADTLRSIHISKIYDCF